MGELTWGTPLFFDLWVAGMAGGAYFVAFLVNLLIGDKEDRLLKLSTYIGVPLVLLGVVARWHCRLHAPLAFRFM